MWKNYWLIVIIILLIQIAGCGTNDHSSNQKTAVSNEPVYTLQIKTDSLFNSIQGICQLAIHKNSLDRYTIHIGYNETDLIKTSHIADNNGAVAAINGSFFNMDEGGSVTYFEINDKQANEAEFIFWQRYEENTEPDLIIRTGKHYILFEAKYFSDFNEGSSKTALSKN